MMDVLTAIIESLFLDAYARKEDAAGVAELQERMARAVAGRLGAGAGGGAAGADSASGAAFVLRARAELLEELSAIEDAADASRKARSGGGKGDSSAAAAVYGVQPGDLDVLDAALRALEASMPDAARP
jgi:hypothetical protein